MKRVLILLLLMFTSITMYSQGKHWSVSGGVDPKLLFFGTDNEFTTHDSALNAQLKVEYHGRDNDIYFAIGIEYADLQEEFRAWFMSYGVPITFEVFNVEILFIPQLEFGSIIRESVNYHTDWVDRYYYGVNIPFRYAITDWFSIELEGSVDRAVDLPDRAWRYGGKFNLIIYL